MGYEDLYLAHQSVVERAIASVCRRHGLSVADREDFAADVRLYLIEDDYAPLRKFQGRSSLYVYLLAVIAHRVRDWRNARWGKWRSSAEARRQGEVAILLERLIVRDGLTFDEAVETLRTNFQITESPASLAERAATFPARTSRRFISDEGLDDMAAAIPAAGADTVDRQEAAGAARRAQAVLARACLDLPPQDRIILAMRFEDDISVADIARALHLNQKELYRRITRLLHGLRDALSGHGLTHETVSELFRDRGFDHLGDESGAETRAPVRLFERGNDAPAPSRRTP